MRKELPRLRDRLRRDVAAAKECQLVASTRDPNCRESQRREVATVPVLGPSRNAASAALTNVNRPAVFQAFNPFTETPVEGVHWALDPNFGTATSRFGYQVPRTFRMSLGVRF